MKPHGLSLHTHHNGENTNVGEDAEKLTQMFLVLIENETAILGNILAFLIKLNLYLSGNPAFAFLYFAQ